MGGKCLKSETAGLSSLKEKILAEQGLDLRRYKDNYIVRRISSRLTATECGSIPAYIRHLDTHPEEWKRLMDRLTVNVTRFFRNESTWEMIERKVLPALLREKVAQRRPLVRVWSAGCSDGKEPYSISILMEKAIAALGEIDPALRYGITATDIDELSLARARSGLYVDLPLQRLEDEVPLRHRGQFVIGENGWQVKEVHLEAIRFAHLDLLKAFDYKHFDLILCRNVLIYLDTESQLRIITGFHRALNHGGFLVLGRTEILRTELRHLLQTFDAAERVFRKPPRGLTVEL